MLGPRAPVLSRATFLAATGALFELQAAVLLGYVCSKHLDSHWQALVCIMRLGSMWEELPLPSQPSTISGTRESQPTEASRPPGINLTLLSALNNSHLRADGMNSTGDVRCGRLRQSPVPGNVVGCWRLDSEILRPSISAVRPPVFPAEPATKDRVWPP